MGIFVPRFSLCFDVIVIFKASGALVDLDTVVCFENGSVVGIVEG